MGIQLFVPTFRIEECLESIRECLEKGWTGIGYKTVAFEKAWKDYTGLPYAHFLNSATAGLHLAVKVLKMRYQWDEQTEIISTPLTFVSTNHAISYEGLKIVFADVDESLCLDPKSIEARITPHTKAVMYVGIGGNVGEYEKVVELCKKYNLKLILDAAHMAGTRLYGEHVGKEADAVSYSFQAVKNLPTGDSGMICFKDEADDKLARKLSWLGIDKDTYQRKQGDYKWQYEVDYLGYKYNGNAIMAAIGLVQLKYLDEDNHKRQERAAWYDGCFDNFNTPIRRIEVVPHCSSSRHLYSIRVANRDELLEKLNEAGIYPGVHYRDNTEYSMYRYAWGSCPFSHQVSQEILSLPLHLQLTKEDVEKVAKEVVKYAK